MNKLVLIAVLLQLCLSVLDVNASSGASAGDTVGEEVNEDKLKFGDLIVFSNKKYSHYGVYVGDEPFKGKTPGQNIFEMTNKPAGCRFIQLSGPFRRHNYLDPGIALEGQSRQPQNDDTIKHTIQELMQKDVCKNYSLIKGNCEHIATKVRYGEAFCKQEGTKAAFFAKLLPKSKLKRHEASAAA